MVACRRPGNGTPEEEEAKRVKAKLHPVVWTVLQVLGNRVLPPTSENSAYLSSLLGDLRQQASRNLALHAASFFKRLYKAVRIETQRLWNLTPKQTHGYARAVFVHLLGKEAAVALRNDDDDDDNGGGGGDGGSPDNSDDEDEDEDEDEDDEEEEKKQEKKRRSVGVATLVTEAQVLSEAEAMQVVIAALNLEMPIEGCSHDDCGYDGCGHGGGCGHGACPKGDACAHATEHTHEFVDDDNDDSYAEKPTGRVPSDYPVDATLLAALRTALLEPRPAARRDGESAPVLADLITARAAQTRPLATDERAAAQAATDALCSAGHASTARRSARAQLDEAITDAEAEKRAAETAKESAAAAVAAAAAALDAAALTAAQGLLTAAANALAEIEAELADAVKERDTAARSVSKAKRKDVPPTAGRLVRLDQARARWTAASAAYKRAQYAFADARAHLARHAGLARAPSEEAQATAAAAAAEAHTAATKRVQEAKAAQVENLKVHAMLRAGKKKKGEAAKAEALADERQAAAEAAMARVEEAEEAVREARAAWLAAQLARALPPRPSKEAAKSHIIQYLALMDVLNVVFADYEAETVRSVMRPRRIRWTCAMLH